MKRLTFILILIVFLLIFFYSKHSVTGQATAEQYCDGKIFHFAAGQFSCTEGCDAQNGCCGAPNEPCCTKENSIDKECKTGLNCINKFCKDVSEETPSGTEQTSRSIFEDEKLNSKISKRQSEIRSCQVSFTKPCGQEIGKISGHQYECKISSDSQTYWQDLGESSSCQIQKGAGCTSPANNEAPQQSQQCSYTNLNYIRIDAYYQNYFVPLALKKENSQINFYYDGDSKIESTIFTANLITNVNSELVISDNQNCFYYKVHYHQDPIAENYFAQLNRKDSSGNCIYTIPNTENNYPPGTERCRDDPGNALRCFYGYDTYLCNFFSPSVDVDFGILVENCGSSYNVVVDNNQQPISQDTLTQVRSGEGIYGDCLKRHEKESEEIEIENVELRLDYKDTKNNFDYLETLRLRGIDSQKYLEKSSINGKDYLIVTTDAGFEDRETKGLVCTAILSNAASQNTIMEFIIEKFKDEQTKISETRVTTASPEVICNSLNGKTICVYKLPENILERGTAINCKFTVASSSQQKTKESSEKIVVAQYVFFILNQYKNEGVEWIMSLYRTLPTIKYATKLTPQIREQIAKDAEKKCIKVSEVNAVSLNFLSENSEFNDYFNSAVKDLQITPTNQLKDYAPILFEDFLELKNINFKIPLEYMQNLGDFSLDLKKDRIVFYTYLAVDTSGFVILSNPWLIYIAPIKRPASADSSMTLMHELGHSMANLCDEYSYTQGATFFGIPWAPEGYGWYKRNEEIKMHGGTGCPNPWPECCKHEWGVTGGCGNWTSCPGMPFDINRQSLESRTLSITDSQIKYYSVMSNPTKRSENNVFTNSLTYPTRSDKKDYCPLRSNEYGLCNTIVFA